MTDDEKIKVLETQLEWLTEQHRRVVYTLYILKFSKFLGEEDE